MADDFFNQKYQTQRLNRDITKDLVALEKEEDDDKEEDDPFAEKKSPDRPFDRKASIDPLEKGQCTLEDLLNGYVVNPSALQSVDECLYYMSLEWDASDILTKDVSHCDKLLNKKCFKSHNLLLQKLLDPPDFIYNQLLRLTRKMKAVNLVIGNQKMVHIPHNAEQLESILDRLSGVSGIISVRTNRRTLDKTIETINDEPDYNYDDAKDIDDDDDESDDDIPEPKEQSAPAQPDLYDISRDLESLIFTNRMLYKETSVCKSRDQQPVRKRLSALTKSAPTQPLAKPNTTTLVQIEEQLANSTAIKGEKDIEMVVDDKSKPKNREAHHVKGLKCEGCGNSMNLVDCYDTAITYQVPILFDKLFYFHDSFCVTLRRLKESIRRFVMDQSLPEARRATTSVGYVRNLLANFNTLITTLGELPRPNPFPEMSHNSFSGSFNHKKIGNKPYLQQMSYIRSSVHKLILRQEAINNRDAKNFADEYDWKFNDIPQSIQYCNMTIYGPSLSEYVIQQLLSKQIDSLWLTLAFIAQGMEATTALQILNEHRASLAKVKEMQNLDLVLMSMIESSNYTIAMALYLSAWMLENAEQDLSRAADFEHVGEKYIRIASSLVASVESDHLLSLLLETPTDIAHLSVFEIAIKYGIHNFMDDSRIQMLMAHMWSEFDFLNPQRSFRTQDITLYELLGRLMWKPNTFYYCPVGRYWTESVMYVTYVFIVTGVVYQKNYDLSSSLSGLEVIMWIFNIGFVLGELTQMLFEGVAYLTEAGNMFDILIMANWFLLALLRFGCKSVFSGSKQCNFVGSTSAGNRATEGDKSAVLIYMAIFCFQICVVWSRCALIFATQRSVGPFISMIPGMVKDILNWTFVLGIFYMGFCFGTNFIIDADISSEEECGAEGDMNGLSLVFEYNFILLMGQSEWGLLNENNCLGPNRSLVLKIYMWAFSVIGTVLLLNLLIAMMASTYEQIREGTAKQVNFSRAEQTFSLSHRNAIIPPPLNVVAFVFAIIWWALEFLVWIISLSGYIMNVEKLVPVYIDYDEDFDEFENSNRRNEDKTKLICCGLFQKLKNPSELFKIKIAQNWSSTARYCQFCRCYMRIPGNISHYFQLFIIYRLDEEDVKFMKSLMQTAGICPQCYRPYRKYDGDNKTNRLYRWQVILEVLSFYVFMICIYLPLIILIALPALFNGLFALMDDIISATKLVESGPNIIKDDKYVQLVEDIMDEESNTDSDVLGAQVAHLNRKLIQIKQNQSSTSNVLAEQSIYLEEHGRILKAMVPYIRKIDTKMDKSMSSTKALHKQQISIFTTEMKEQSGLIQASRGVLDAHTGYNKQHQEELEQQRLIAKQHQEEMEFFKQELENLRKLKKQQFEQQQKLEKQQNDQITAFNKELKQQRVLREIEISKQERMNKKQNDQLKLQHEQQLLTLQKQIDRQQFLRSIEDKKHKEEQQKRELLSLRQQQDMQTLTAQLEQINKMQEIERRRKEIEEKERRQYDKKMKDIENEILSLKKIKQQQDAQKKRNSFALQQTKRMEHLQSKLILMKAERQKHNANSKANLELNELKLIQQKNKVKGLVEKMEALAKKQKKNNQSDIIAKRNHEKQHMQHLIAVEKLKKSVTVLKLNISASFDDNDNDNKNIKYADDDDKDNNNDDDDDNDDNDDYDNGDDDDRDAP